MNERKKLFENPKVAKSFYSLLVCSLCLVVGCLAWFYNGTVGKADTIEMASIQAADFEISLNGSTYSNEVALVFPANLQFEPISGDGLSDEMYIPVLPVDGSDATLASDWVSTEYDETADQNSYYKFRLYFRSDLAGYAGVSGVTIRPEAAAANRQGSNYTDVNGDTVVSAGANSVVRPVKDTMLYELIIGNPVISKDYIAGAARVSMQIPEKEDETPDEPEPTEQSEPTEQPGQTEQPEQTEPTQQPDQSEPAENTPDANVIQKAIFIPNDTYHLNFAVDGTACSCSFVENWNTPETYSYYDGNSIVGYESLNIYKESELSEDEPVCMICFEGEPDEDGFYYAQLDVCIWLEGFDNEAKEIMAGGKFLVNLKFEFIV